MARVLGARKPLDDSAIERGPLGLHTGQSKGLLATMVANAAPAELRDEALKV